jgi:methionyl-tRNA formyltransferase
MRILFFGTPDLAVPSLRRLIESHFDVVGVVSQPDRRRGRGRKTSPSPVAEQALEHGIPLLRPEHVGDVDDELERLDADVGVVVAFGQFIPKKIRELPRRGFLINAHASLLPRHRGAAPIQAAILAGDETTGITVMRVEREMDAGAMALTREIAIGEQEDAGALAERLSQLAADALLDALEELDASRLEWTEQDHSAATEAGKFDRETARIDWRAPAIQLHRQVRAFAPKPGAFTTLEGDTLRVLTAHVDPSAHGEAPGTVECDGRSTLRIATGDGWLVPDTIQRAGGKAMAPDAYLRGREIPNGICLAADEDADRANASPGTNAGATHG